MIRHPVSISLSSYGAPLVRDRGQADFIDLVADAGASLIELREELGLPDEHELPALAEAIAARGLRCVYSSPMQLWTEAGTLDLHGLETALHKAQACGAQWLKVSLGHFGAGRDVTPLLALLTPPAVRLLVENDQTPQGGRIAPLAAFFNAACEAEVPVGMTLDIGNWQWQEQPLFGALEALGQAVEYVHCKGVQLSTASPAKRVATPPSLHDLHLWEQVLQRLRPGIVRAIEFPLQGDDLLQVTQTHVTALAELGQARPVKQETAHV